MELHIGPKAQCGKTDRGSNGAERKGQGNLTAKSREKWPIRLFLHNFRRFRPREWATGGGKVRYGETQLRGWALHPTLDCMEVRASFSVSGSPFHVQLHFFE